MEQEQTNRTQWSVETYGIEIPPEVQRKIVQEGTNHRITEMDVADLQYIDISGRPYRFAKRFFDIILSALGLLVLFIPLTIICVLIYIDDPGKVIFRQYRIGLHGRRYRAYKLRTMSALTPKYMATGEVENPDLYITRIGHVLRRLSIDELPQLFNVLKGDMSLIGPRPLIADEYEIHEMRMRFGVYNIRPGITGLAQINGRDIVSPVEKVHWDVKYLQEYGFRMDIYIMLETIFKVFIRSDVVEGKQRTSTIDSLSRRKT